MLKISDAVAELLRNDAVALEAYRANLLNLSAYADKIHSAVEKMTYKEVKRGTIVVAISRIAKTSLKKVPALKPDIKISNLSVKSPVYSLTYTKTADVERRISTLNPFLVTPNDLFAVTDGASEIVLICTQKAVDLIKGHIEVKPKNEINDLVALTVQFPESYNKTPNILYVLFSALAGRRINVVNLISTFSETSFIVNKKDLETVVAIFNVYT